MSNDLRRLMRAFARGAENPYGKPDFRDPKADFGYEDKETGAQKAARTAGEIASNLNPFKW